MGGQGKTYEENKLGRGMKRSVRTYLKREHCGSCGKRMVAKISKWMQ